MWFKTRIKLNFVDDRSGQVMRNALPVLRDWTRKESMETLLRAIRVEMVRLCNKTQRESALQERESVRQCVCVYVS